MMPHKIVLVKNLYQHHEFIFERNDVDDWYYHVCQVQCSNKNEKIYPERDVKISVTRN